MADSGPPQSTPDTLRDICVNYCVNHTETFSTTGCDGMPCLIPNLSLPVDLCDILVNILCDRYRPDTKWLNLFKDPLRSQLTQLNVRKCDISHEQLCYLTDHPLCELSLSHCGAVGEGIVDNVNKLTKTLRTLKFEGSESGILEAIETSLEHVYNTKTAACLYGDGFGTDFIFNCPNLRFLCLRDMAFQESSYGHDVLGTMLCPLHKLTHLDLSRCSIELEYMDCLEELRCILSLNLHGIVITDLKEALKNICKVKSLRHLDISQEVEENNLALSNINSINYTHYEEPSVCLRYIVQHLPNLTSLDLSGTDLPGVEVSEVSHKPEPSINAHQGDGDQSKCSIEGLEGRYFDFLGLLDCFDSPSKRENLPAKKVTGIANEEQIMLALHRYVDRIHAMSSALNSLFHLFRYLTVKDHRAALEAILNGMEMHFDDKHIQISGSASLFYIVKGEQKNSINQREKRKIVRCLLNAMEQHSREQTMVRNGCLTFCHLDIPQDVLFCYKRLVSVLICVLNGDHQEEFMQRISIYLLNCLACQVDGDEKQTVGDLGAVEVMLEIIKKKLMLDVCDEILEVAWSTLWNVTDETAKNCLRFMEGHGMDLFLQCLKRFPDRAELLRNMMGLMGNIAEVKDLRPRLMKSEYISVFSDLLASESDGIEVSYNSAGMLAHITSDGQECWTIQHPSREEVMDRMITAIKRWPLNSKRNINYRSFLPILSLVKAWDTAAAQYWAVWALCNLTRVYPEKYCSLLKKEEGIEILSKVLRDKRVLPEVRELARKVLDLILRYKGDNFQEEEDMLVDDEAGRDGEEEDEFDLENDENINDDDVSSDEN